MTQNEIELMFQGRILDDERTVEECEMCEASVVDIIGKLRGGMQINAETMDGKSFDIFVSSNDKIMDVKKKIQAKIGRNPDEQKLIFQGGILENDKTVGEYGIAEKSVINVIHSLKGGMQIFARTMDGKIVVFEVSKNEKIIDFKKKIREKIGMNPDEQNLVFNGGILKDDKTVGECGIIEKSCINIIARLRGGMQIFATTMDGRTFVFEVSKNEKIIDFKKKIQEKIGMDPGRQNLVFQCGILQDDKTIEECGIFDKSCINFVSRLM